MLWRGHRLGPSPQGLQSTQGHRVSRHPILGHRETGRAEDLGSEGILGAEPCEGFQQAGLVGGAFLDQILISDNL